MSNEEVRLAKLARCSGDITSSAIGRIGLALGQTVIVVSVDEDLAEVRAQEGLSIDCTWFVLLCDLELLE